MTSNSDKLRSLILAALMVFSVFAGTVALTGSAAAANDASFGDITADTGSFVGNTDGVVAEDQQQQHTLTFTLDGLASGSGDETEVSVTLPAGEYDNVDDVTVTTSGSVADASNPISEDGQTATFNISAADSDETIDVQFTANWPEVDETTSGPLTVSAVDSNDEVDEDIATLTIVNNELDAGTFYGGQEVTFVASANTDYEVSQVTGDNDDQVGTLERVLTTDGQGVAAFDLDGDLSEGTFVVTEESSGNVLDISGGTPDDVSTDQFDVTSQDLTAEFDDASVGNDGGSTTVDYDISSDVRNDYNVNISAQGDLDTEELAGIFGGDNVVTNYTDDDIVTVAGDTEYTLDFVDVDADTYTFEANVTDTSASDADDIEVTDTGDASADFGDNVYTDQRGDIVNITVEMSNTDEATLQIGDSDNGYAVTADVIDDDEDGVAYVEFNSFIAGNASEIDSTLVGGDDDTNVENVRSNFNDNDAPATDILDATDYDMYVAEGVDYGATVGSDNADARATLSLSEASVDNLQLWTAPEDTLSDLESADVEDIPAYAQAGNLTQTSTIAEGDTVVVQVEASGLEGALENRGITGTPTELYNTTSNASELFNLTFEGEDIPNVGETSTNIANLSTDNYSVLYDGAADAHYVVIDSTSLIDQFSEHEDGDEYTANFTVYEDPGDLVDDSVSLTGDFDVENPDAELDTNADDEIVLQAAAGQEVTGTTNLAPGTEIELSLDSDTSGDPFVVRPEATVQADGSFTAVADFSENDAGSEFTASISDPSGFTDEYDGRLVEATVTPGTATATPDEGTATATPDEGTATPDEGTATPEPDTATPEPDTATAAEETTEGGAATETATGGSGPGFTAALALIALVAAALLAVRRNN